MVEGWRRSRIGREYLLSCISAILISLLQVTPHLRHRSRPISSAGDIESFYITALLKMIYQVIIGKKKKEKRKRKKEERKRESIINNGLENLGLGHTRYSQYSKKHRHAGRASNQETGQTVDSISKCSMPLSSIFKVKPLITDLRINIESKRI